MYLSPAQLKAQGLLMDELGKELDEMDRAFKRSRYPESETVKVQNDGGRYAVKWIREWITDKQKENA